MKFLMAVVIFLFIGFFFIIAENNINISDTSNLGKFIGLYFSWLGDITYNSWQIAGYAVKLEWLPDNNNQTQNIELTPSQIPSESFP